MEWILFGIALIAVIGFYCMIVFNQIVRYSVKIQEAFSNIDVALSKRYHVLTQLFEVAKGYAKHEREVLYNVVKLRNTMSLEEKQDAESIINQGYDKLMVLQEAYPELKADRLFLNLQDGARDAEEHLQAARRLYNSNVSLYNQRIQTFPGVLIANKMKTTHYDMYKAPAHEVENVDLKM